MDKVYFSEFQDPNEWDTKGGTLKGLALKFGDTWYSLWWLAFAIDGPRVKRLVFFPWAGWWMRRLDK